MHVCNVAFRIKVKFRIGLDVTYLLNEINLLLKINSIQTLWREKNERFLLKDLIFRPGLPKLNLATSIFSKS